MKRSVYALAMIPVWLFFWAMLAGAQGSCFGSGSTCDNLDEQACLANPDCQAVYQESNWDYAEGLRCMDPNLRCVGPEVFDHCEDRPSCDGLGEQDCLAQSSCQAIYGWTYDSFADTKGGLSPQCGGARCLEPVQEFLECLDADADPCVNLTEEECWSRPMCTADYGPSCYDETTGIAEMPCGEGGFIGCRRIDGFCRTDLDCYNMPYPADGGVSSDLMYCPNGGYTCQYGQCVYSCGSGCQSDYDCATGERCEVTCYACTADGQCPGCIGSCVPAEDCQVTGCPAGFECQVSCYDCAGGTEDCLGGCTGVCVEVQVYCSSDADCPAGYACQWPDAEDVPCDPETGCGKMAGVCVPVSTGCTSDADCPAGMVCQLMPCDCVNPDETGWCEECYAQLGQCVPGPQDCQVTGCPEGYECQVSCADCAPDAGDCLGGCVGTCVPVQPPCYSDADCAAGEVCELNCPVCEPGYDCFVACMGVCVPAQPQCWSDADCAAGETCQLTCPECPAGAECDVACSGVCVPAQQFCTSDAECSAGQVCVVDSWCTPDSWCGGVCTNVVWMSLSPLQCSQTPWEIDAQQNPDLYAECMVDCGGGADCGNGWAELCILQKFLGFQGIVTYDARNVQDYGEVCASCACPRGNTLYLLVKEGDVGLLEGYGFWPMTVGIK